MRVRRLTGAEIDIWRRVAETVTPRPGSMLPEAAAPPAPEPALPSRAVVAQPAPVRTYGAASYSPPVSVSKPAPVGIERRLKRKIAIGRIAVDAALDLHGMTQAQAHSALRSFLWEKQRDGARVVIVVTGKGVRDYHRTDAAEPGVLRRAVPHWLRDAGLREIVIGFEEAALGHGGAGALYVRLRRASATR